MKTVSPQEFNVGLSLLSKGKVVLFHNDDLSLDDWLNGIYLTVNEDCVPFGYFFDYAKLVDFDADEIYTYLDLESPTSGRAEQF